MKTNFLVWLGQEGWRIEWPSEVFNNFKWAVDKNMSFLCLANDALCALSSAKDEGWKRLRNLWKSDVMQDDAVMIRFSKILQYTSLSSPISRPTTCLYWEFRVQSLSMRSCKRCGVILNSGVKAPSTTIPPPPPITCCLPIYSTCNLHHLINIFNSLRPSDAYMGR